LSIVSSAPNGASLKRQCSRFEAVGGKVQIQLGNGSALSIEKVCVSLFLSSTISGCNDDYRVNKLLSKSLFLVFGYLLILIGS
jgi:hypothetical protein